MDTSGHEFEENLLSDEAVRRPHDYFARLREHDPVHWNPRHKAWVLTRHQDVHAALRNPALTAERITPFETAVNRAAESDAVDDTFQILKDWLVFRDPPEHTRLRTLVARAFTPRVVRAREAEIEQTVAQLLDELRGADEVELIGSFAYPLPAVVIAQMLGVPPDERDLFKAWSDKLSALVFGAYGQEDRFHSAALAMLELRDYLVDLIAHFEQHPGENLISVLLEKEGDDALSRQELVATCTLLLFGGHETTTNLIGNGMLALLSNRDQLARLQSDPSLIDSAVEEIVRFDGPARATVRLVREAHEIDGRQLSPGERVFLINLAANRDPAAYADPDGLDIARSASNHTGFGVGIHYCLGAPLARLEARLAIMGLIESFPELELSTTPEALDWHPTMLSRGLIELPLALRSA